MLLRLVVHGARTVERLRLVVAPQPHEVDLLRNGLDLLPLRVDSQHHEAERERREVARQRLELGRERKRVLRFAMEALLLQMKGESQRRGVNSQQQEVERPGPSQVDGAAVRLFQGRG